MNGIWIAKVRSKILVVLSVGLFEIIFIQNDSYRPRLEGCNYSLLAKKYVLLMF